MSADLLSYTDEGQDWASRCPPIAADALSFFAFCHRSQRRCPGIFRASLVVGALVPLKKRPVVGRASGPDKARLRRFSAVARGRRRGAQMRTAAWRGNDNAGQDFRDRSEEHTSELQSLRHLVCRLLLEKKKNKKRLS